MRVVEGRAEVEDSEAFLEELRAIGEATGCAVQAFDARYVVGREHLERAVELAERAFDRGENVARDPAVEILLYAAGRRQIDRSLTMGVGEGEVPVAVVVHSFDRDTDETVEAAERDDAEAAAAERVRELLAPDETLGAEHVDESRIREFFDVTEAERSAAAGGLQDLVLERVALLDVRK